MKKLLCLILALMLLMMAGCAAAERTVAENDAYAVMEYNGIYTLRFREPLPSNKSSGGASAQLTGGEPITFRSVAEMKAAIEGGTFTKKQIETIRKYFKRSGNEILSLNTNKLYELVLPEGMEVADVSWYGSSYSFSIEHGTTSGSVNLYTKAQYQNDLQEQKEYIAELPTETAQQLAERNATQYEYVSPYGIEVKVIAYTYTSGNKTLNVLEYYNPKDSDIGPASSTIPNQIEILGEDGGAYFHAVLLYLTKRPSYEWIQSFGLKPYTQTAVK